MTDPEAAKIIDDLICLFSFGSDTPGEPLAVQSGIAYLMQTRREHPELESKFKLWGEMAKRGLTT